MIFIASGEGQIDQRACYCKEDIRKAYIDFVLGGNDEGFHDRELSSFMENFEDGDNWMLDTIYRCEIGETGHIEIIRVDCALSAIPRFQDQNRLEWVCERLAQHSMYIKQYDHAHELPRGGFAFYTNSTLLGYGETIVDAIDAAMKAKAANVK